MAGLLIARHAATRERLGTVLQSLPGVPTAYAALVVLLGPASAAMHATQSSLGGHLDLLSMYLVASFVASYALTRWWRRGPGFLGAAFALGVAGCEAVALVWRGEVPVVTWSGNVAFAALLLLGLVVEVRLRRKGRTTVDVRWGVAALASMLVGFGIWNASKTLWCDPGSLLQGHAAWHVLCALAAYCLFRYYATETER